MKKYLLPILILLFCSATYALAQIKPRSAVCMVRVAVVRESREIDLEIEGQYNFRDGVSGKVFATGPRLPKAPIRLLDKGILIGMKV